MTTGRTSARGRAIGLLVLAALCFTASQAMATSDVKAVWMSTYPSSTLAATYSCTLCHTSAPSFNPYGAAIASAGPTTTGIKSIEPLDSDGDSFTNITEIDANTLPGDATSHPTAVAPVASFTATPTSGAAPLTVTFTDTSTNAPTSWSWTFGDGGVSSERNPSHEYTTIGSYDVSLTVGNATGQDTKTTQGYIVVAFSDVPADYWALPQILACVGADIVQGYPDGSYGPTGPVSRDQMAVFIARGLAGGDAAVPTGPPTATFEDVPDTGYGSGGTDPYWAYKYIEYCVAHGVVRGYDATHYAPTTVVTRDQMAVFVARAKGWVLAGDDMTTAPELFPDIPAGFWAGTAIQACVDHGVVVGYPDGTYTPTGEVTRDQMAVFVARAFSLVP